MYRNEINFSQPRFPLVLRTVRPFVSTVSKRILFMPVELAYRIRIREKRENNIRSTCTDTCSGRNVRFGGGSSRSQRGGGKPMCVSNYPG